MRIRPTGFFPARETVTGLGERAGNRFERSVVIRLVVAAENLVGEVVEQFPVVDERDPEVT